MGITLSQKEKMLLQDQKSHEELCIKKYSDYANEAQDNQLKQIFKTNEQDERNHLDSINQLLSGNVPQMNAQSQSLQSNMNNMQPASGNMSDKEMCEDVLTTEKYVSGTYDTTIFEFRDTGARDVLNHIQKEEQKHGEAVFKYMESKGMYNVQ